MEADTSRMPAWDKRQVSPQAVVENIAPGMQVYIGSGPMEPSVLVQAVIASETFRYKDIDLIQRDPCGALAEAFLKDPKAFGFRTFCASCRLPDGELADMPGYIPVRMSELGSLIRLKQIPIDAVLIRVTPPDSAGYCCLGPGADVMLEAMEGATFVAAEIDPGLPQTTGSTRVSADRIDVFVDPSRNGAGRSGSRPEKPSPTVAGIGRNAAALIDNGATLAFWNHPLFNAVARFLSARRDLGVHTPWFTEPLMDLVTAGCVTNQRRYPNRAASTAAFAIGGERLFRWLDHNPRVAFEGPDQVFSPRAVGRQPGFTFILPVGRMDLSGAVIELVPSCVGGPTREEAQELVEGTGLSRGGLLIAAIPSRDPHGRPAIDLPPVNGLAGLWRDRIDYAVTEYGTAHLKARSLRERAQALIDIAHPGDREGLVQQARQAGLLHKNQVFLPECSWIYPSEIETVHTFKHGITLTFRAIKPSDEEMMRALFYRVSKETVYYRYFSPLKTMPHDRMQEYVNADCQSVLSIVALTTDSSTPRIVAEARYLRDGTRTSAEVAFLVDEAFHGIGVGTFLFRMLMRLARERGITQFTADVLAANKAMLTVFERGGVPVSAQLLHGVYQITMPLSDPDPDNRTPPVPET